MIVMDDSFTAVCALSDSIQTLMLNPDALTPFIAFAALIAFYFGLFFWIGFRFFPNFKFCFKCLARFIRRRFHRSGDDSRTDEK